MRFEYHYKRIFRQTVTVETWWWSGSYLSALITSVLSLIKLLSARRKWQVRQHKDKQTTCTSSPQKVAEVISALPGLIHVPAAPTAKLHPYHQGPPPDLAVPSLSNWAELARKLFLHKKFWKKSEREDNGLLSKFTITVTFSGKLQTNQEQVRLWTSPPGPSPSNTQISN